MTIYFCINDVLDRLEKTARKNTHEDTNGDTNEDTENNTDQDAVLDTLITVNQTPPACGGFREDVFTLSSHPKILWLDDEDAVADLALLLNEVPLYHINMELTLDAALLARKQDATVDKALKKAFGNTPLPRAMETPHDIARQDDKPALTTALSKNNIPEKDMTDGALHHPVIGHMSLERLTRIYLAFLKALGAHHRDYSFEQNILGPHEKRFSSFFDGFMHGGTGKVKASLLIGFSRRMDHDPGKRLEAYREEGEETARNMNIENEQELLWAWLEADHYQQRRSRDIHRMQSLKILPQTPGWVRNDVMALIGREAMKQVFANALMEKDPSLTLLDKAPLIKKTVAANAQGTVEPVLQKLLTQILNEKNGYAGAGGVLTENAQKRREQARKAGLV